MGLELALIPYGDLVYFHRRREELAVVHYGDAKANYEFSSEKVARERIKQRDLTTVKEVRNRTVYPEFDLHVQRDLVKGVRVAGVRFPRREDALVLRFEREQKLPQILAFALQELDAGNDEPFHALSPREQELVLAVQ